MAAIREAYEAGGCRVVGLAPTNAVAQDMLGGGFRHARTIHSELFALNNGRTAWSRRTVVMVDEAAMVDTKLMAMLAAHAYAAGAKLILVGDDRQLSSIDRGGMFSALKDRYGAASLTEVRRQLKNDERRATEMMAEGNFHDALAGYAARGHIHWAGSPEGARAALVRRWEADSAADPGKTRFVFAYTNVDVDELNRDLRRVRQTRGELGTSMSFETKHGKHDFAEGDRVQFTGTDKTLNIYNGNAGVIRRIEGSRIVVCLDGKDGPLLAFDAAAFKDFRHGYAGTIYKGQGRTIDQTYLYHSAHWRRAASYVALSRHREKAELFVARQRRPNIFLSSGTDTRTSHLTSWVLPSGCVGKEPTDGRSILHVLTIG
jgi:ATP-dependent exoDNAse (exonuclease V) alpha subunit